jgi:hypothetical protein
MIGFETAINGQKVCTAAVGDMGVVSVIATWVRRASRGVTSAATIPDQFEEELILDVGGLAREADGSAVDVKWIAQPLVVGQQIRLTVVNTEVADPPKTRHRDDPADVERSKREYYERLKRECGDA